MLPAALVMRRDKSGARENRMPKAAVSDNAVASAYAELLFCVVWRGGLLDPVPGEGAAYEIALYFAKASSKLSKSLEAQASQLKQGHFDEQAIERSQKRLARLLLLRKDIIRRTSEHFASSGKRRCRVAGREVARRHIEAVCGRHRQKIN